MTIKKIIDSKIKTMTDLSGNKTKILYLKNEKEINEFKQQLSNNSVTNKEKILAYHKYLTEELSLNLDELWADKFVEEKLISNITCDECGNTGKGEPTLQEPDGVDCEKCSNKQKIMNNDRHKAG